jgi:hypothetical protein
MEQLLIGVRLVTLTSGVSYESIPSVFTSHLILNVPQYTTGINLQDGNVVGQQMTIQVKSNLVVIITPPLYLPDNPALTNINLGNNLNMYNNTILTLI